MRNTEALGDRICELAAHLNAANCRLLELIARFDNEEGWGVDGCNSCAHWLNWKCGLGQNAARDKGCRFPGCGATRHLHGHRLEHWADGGGTSLDNLVQLCPHHHRLVHEGGFDVRALRHGHGDDGAVSIGFYRPDGSRIKDVVPRHSIAACAETSLKQPNTNLGLVIDHGAAFPNWDGEPMDLAMAIDAMFTASGDHAMRAEGVSAETFVGEVV